jgi:hypothetical protein
MLSAYFRFKVGNNCPISTTGWNQDKSFHLKMLPTPAIKAPARVLVRAVLQLPLPERIFKE